MVPRGVLLVHYLDDFLLIFTNPSVLQGEGENDVNTLVCAGFLISPKSVVHPVLLLSFMGKLLDLVRCSVSNRP